MKQMAISRFRTSSGTALVTLLLATAAFGLTAEQKCQQKKLRAHGKLEYCLAKNSAKLLAGKPDDSVKCHTKLAASLAAAGTCRFGDNGDGTVTDYDTGLMWEQKTTDCPPHPGPHCFDDYYGADEWAIDFLNGYITSGSSPVFIPGLNGGFSSDGMMTSGCFAGHCDWRVPKVEELVTIVDTTRGLCAGGTGACIDPIFGPTLEDCYQTSTNVVGFTDYNFKVDFRTGNIESEFRYDSYPVRGVRGGRP
jgi:hypothetical protein